MSDTKGFILIEVLMKGLTLVGLFVVLATIGVQFMIAIPRVTEAREAAIYDAMKRDLENLAARQAIYYSDAQAYSSEPAALRYGSSDGVVVRIAATDAGWAGTATHPGLGPGAGCALYYGDKMVPGGALMPSVPGEMACTED